MYTPDRYGIGSGGGDSSVHQRSPKNINSSPTPMEGIGFLQGGGFCKAKQIIIRIEAYVSEAYM